MDAVLRAVRLTIFGNIDINNSMSIFRNRVIGARGIKYQTAEIHTLISRSVKFAEPLVTSIKAGELQFSHQTRSDAQPVYSYICKLIGIGRGERRRSEA